MKIFIGKDEYWIDDLKIPSNFNFMDDFEKLGYIIDNNLIHRENGPAVIYPNGDKEYYLNGKRHRIDGPAILFYSKSEWWSNRHQGWWLNDIKVDREIYQKIQNSSKEELLLYMINSKYKDYLSLIEYRLSL